MTARCVFPGCPIRFRDGGDRPCRMHSDEEYRLSVRASRFGVLMAEVPGDDGKDGGQAGDQDHGHHPAPATVTRTNRHGVALH